MTIDYDAIVTCEACGCEMTASELDGIITVRGARGEFLGRIYSGDVSGDWDKIACGECPICDGWEDGHGHTCTAYGWEMNDPNFAAGHGIANLVHAGWKYEDRDELKEEFSLSDFEADAYAQAIRAADSWQGSTISL